MEVNIDYNLYSIRLHILDTLKKRIKDFCFLIPDYYVINHSEIPQNFNDLEIVKWAKDNVNQLIDNKFFSNTNQIFVRPCPLDESKYKHLSFAGVYESYKPYKQKNTKENVIDGIIKVMSGRNNEFSKYYYTKHTLSENKKVSLMFSNALENACMFGTAYVFKGKCLIEYFDTPLSIFRNDPIRIVADSNSNLVGINKKVRDNIIEVENFIGVPLDIEFLIDRNEKLYISEVRPISKVHLKNWKAITSNTWESYVNTVPPSNVLNSIGTWSGRIVDLRRRMCNAEDFDDTENKIYLINHSSINQKGTTTLFLLNILTKYNGKNINLIIDHGNRRKNDHLQYITFEDPSLNNIINGNFNSFITDNSTRTIVSNGFEYKIY
jgi:hypothetical protein